MEKKIKQLVVFLGFLLFSSYGIFAQSHNEKQPLSQILNTLQNQHHIQFNYAEDLVEGILLIPPFQEFSLNEALKYIENKTKLSFTITSNNIVLITVKKGFFICGYLKDKDNLQPLESATIQTENQSTISAEDGFFQIKLETENEIVTIRYLGYKTLHLNYNHTENNECKEVFLAPNFVSLSEIVISNYITSGISKINDGSYEINFSEFDILPGLIDNDVLQSIQAFPGIQSINETVSNLNIRGGTHDQNLILWDDIKMYQSGHFFGLISMYNPQITQKVSLRKNGSDVTYTDGVSGTISMQTDSNINPKFEGVLGVNMTNFNGFADIPISKKSSIQIAARKSISDFIETPTYNAFFDRISQNTEVENNTTTITNSDKAFDFYDTSLRWLYKISDKDELRLNFINVFNELEFNENAIIDNEEESRQSNLTQNSIAGALSYNRLWNDKFQTTFEVYETDYKLKAVNVNLLDAQLFLQENIVSETSIKLKTDYKINRGLHLLSGYHFVETEVTNLDDVDNPLFRLLISEVVRTHALFSQIGYTSSNKNTSLNFGLRYNYIDKFKKQIIEPRLSFSQRFLDDFTIEVLGEFKHQNTSQIINFQNDFLGIEKRRWQLSNNNTIPIIKSKQVSIGVNYNSNGWLFGVESYYKNVDGITTQSQGFLNQYEFVKTKGSYEVYGLDFLLRKNINNLNTWLSYSYMDNNYIFEAIENNPFPSNYNVSHAITLGTSYALKNLKLSAGLNWHTGKPTTKPVGGNEIVDESINYEATNTSNLKDYMRLDVSALYDFKISTKVKANLGVSVWNVLDKENEINNFYRLNNENITETVQRSLGITPNAVFRVIF